MSSPLDRRACVHLTPGAYPVPRVSRCTFSRAVLFASLALSAVCCACGAVGGSGPPPATAAASVTVQPNSAQPFTGAGVQFKAEVQNASSPTVTWEVNATPGGNSTFGTISSNGYYTAPSQVPGAPTVTVTAVLQADASVSGSASVTIQSLSGIQSLAIGPALSSVTLTQPLQLQVRTPGVTAADVLWAVDGSPGGNATAGTISSTGLFTPGLAGSHTVTASLIANPGAITSAQVEVTDFPGTLTWRNDNARSGVNNRELVLAPSTVNSAHFGTLFACKVDGYVYAQPLYVANLPIPGNGTHNVVFVATEKDSVYAFDADANPCQQLWKTSLIPSGEQAVAVPSQQIPNTLIGPFIGITGTPVIDARASRVYVVAATQTPGLNLFHFDDRLYALDLATGAIIQASSSFDILASQFASATELQRAALLLDDGNVYVAFGSNGAPGDDHGWLFNFDASALQAPQPFNVTPSNGALGGGIWQSGGGPSADLSHNVYVETGDGTFNANILNPFGPVDYADSFLRFGPIVPAGRLSVSDYFTPCDEGTEQEDGNDIGASAPLLLPDSAGFLSRQHLLIGGSKGGSLYVVNRDIMGQSIACPDLPSRVQSVPMSGPILSTPLFWQGSLYVAPGNGNLMSLPMIQGTLATQPSSGSLETLGPQGATPVISANATNNAVLWLIDTSGASSNPNTPAILRAFDPDNLSMELYNSAMVPTRDTAGLAVKFTVPTVANGKVYVGTQSELDVYGLLP